MAWLKRVTYELRNMSDDNEFLIKPIGDSLSELQGILKGPSETPYEGGNFKLKIQIPNQYPFSPPSVKFITKIYHPNIDHNGNICLDVLKSQWSPSLTIEKILLSISSLLNDPNPDDPLRSDVARIYKSDRDTYNKNAKEITKKFAQNVE